MDRRTMELRNLAYALLYGMINTPELRAKWHEAWARFLADDYDTKESQQHGREETWREACCSAEG